MAAYGSEYDFVATTLHYKDAKRATTLANVVRWLATIAGDGTRSEQLKRLHAWACKTVCADYRDLKIHGFGPAGFQYLRMLFGANTAKPDRHICAWVAAATGHPIKPLAASMLLERAAGEAGFRLRDVDTSIWESSARAGASCK
jgi:hypothetical protein